MVIRPEPGWERIFVQLAEERDLHVCFAPGIYRLETSIQISGKRSVRMEGSGAGSRVLCLGNETAFQFSDCEDVILRDFYAETGTVGSANRLEHRNGTLLFEGCRRVTVESVSLQCGGGAMPASTCLTVRSLAQPLDVRPDIGVAVQPAVRQVIRRVEMVRIQSCDLMVGHRQTGILVVDAIRTQIENNTLRAAPRPEGLDWPQLLQNRVYRGRVLRLLLRDLRVDGPRRENEHGDFVVARYGRARCEFRTAPSLVQAWPAAMDANPIVATGRRREAAAGLRRIARTVLTQEGRVAGDPGQFQAWYTNMAGRVGSAFTQGIVVGGQSALEIRIHNNSVYAAIQGIHVGNSFRAVANLAARRVEVINNTVVGTLPADEVGERHGIFLGNCYSGLISGNFLTWSPNTTDRAPEPADGIRAWGRYGRFLHIIRNHMDDFPTGVRVQATALIQARQQHWEVSENMAQDAQNAAVVSAGVRAQRNLT